MNETSTEQPEAEAQPTNRGQFTPESAAAAARKGWERRRQREQELRQATADGSPPPPGSGLATPSEERDRALALRELRRLIRAPKTPDNVRVQAAKILAGVEELTATARPPAIEKLEGLTSEQRQALIATLLPGPPLAR